MSTTTEVAQDAITDYPTPLPHGTRVRLRKDTSATASGTLGTVAAQHGAQGKDDPKGLHVLFDGQTETEYILSGGYGKTACSSYFDVLELPGADRMYLGVRHASVPDARGIIVALSGDDDSDAVVMRTHEHLGIGTQDWMGDWVPDEAPPVYETDCGAMKLGQRVIFSAPYRGMRGTLVGHTDGDTFFLVDAGQQGFDTEPVWSDPDNTDTGTMFSPNSCGWHRLGEKVGTDTDGNPIRIGDRVVYQKGEADGGWSGVVGTVLKKHPTGTLITLVLDPVHHDGSPLDDEQAQYVGPIASECNLQSKEMTVLPPSIPKKDTGHKSKLGQTIYVGDVLEYVPGSKEWAGVIVKALDQDDFDKRFEFVKTNAHTASSGYKVGDGVNLTGGDLVHVYPDDAPTLGAYSDGVAIKKGDRIVVNPGLSFAGHVGTVEGDGEMKEHPGTVEVVLDVHGMKFYDPVNISRLQEDDKEKVADDAPKPLPALERLQQVLDRIDQAKDNVESAISSIASELDDVENGTVEVTVDADEVSDNLTYDVSIETSNSELLSLISYDGCGGLEIDDSGVDSHAAEHASVTFSGEFETNVSLSESLDDLHTAFNTGQQQVQDLLSIVDEAAEVVAQMMADPEVVVKAETVIIPPKECATFQGVVRNARIGITLPEDAETGPTLRFDVVADFVESETGEDSTHTKATRRVRLTGAQIGRFLVTVGVSDVKHLEGRAAILTEDSFGGWYPTAISEVPGLDTVSDDGDLDE